MDWFEVVGWIAGFLMFAAFTRWLLLRKGGASVARLHSVHVNERALFLVGLYVFALIGLLVLAGSIAPLQELPLGVVVVLSVISVLGLSAGFLWAGVVLQRRGYRMLDSRSRHAA
jgi:hypothetical protein